MIETQKQNTEAQTQKTKETELIMTKQIEAQN